MVGLCGNSTSKCLRHNLATSHRGFTGSHSHQQCVRAPISPQPHRYLRSCLVCSDFEARPVHILLSSGTHDQDVLRGYSKDDATGSPGKGRQSLEGTARTCPLLLPAQEGPQSTAPPATKRSNVCGAFVQGSLLETRHLTFSLGAGHSRHQKENTFNKCAVNKAKRPTVTLLPCRTERKTDSNELLHSDESCACGAGTGARESPCKTTRHVAKSDCEARPVHRIHLCRLSTF